MEDLERQVFAALPEDVLLLLLEDGAGAVMGIDDAVADLEVDLLEDDDGFEFLEVSLQFRLVDGFEIVVGGGGVELLLGRLRRISDGVLLVVCDGGARAPRSQVCR
jgi:hypothetical protein